MKEFFTFSKDELLDGINFARNNAKLLAEQSLFLAKKKENTNTALGLYSFALEEWGKCLILQDNFDSNNFKIDAGIFGRSSTPHTSKFARGLDNVPDDCKYFRKVLNDEGTTHVGKTEDGSVKLYGFPKFHGFLGSSKISAGDFLIDFETRKDCFYLNWDDENKRWKIQPPVENKDLKNKINNFLKYLQTKN